VDLILAATSAVLGSKILEDSAGGSGSICFCDNWMVLCSLALGALVYWLACIRNPQHIAVYYILYFSLFLPQFNLVAVQNQVLYNCWHLPYMLSLLSPSWSNYHISKIASDVLPMLFLVWLIVWCRVIVTVRVIVSVGVIGSVRGIVYIVGLPSQSWRNHMILVGLLPISEWSNYYSLEIVRVQFMLYISHITC